MPQRPRPRNYRKRQQESDDDEEQVGVAECGVKEDQASEEDSVRSVFCSGAQSMAHYYVIFPEKSLKKLKSSRNSERNRQE